jgi:hypothetical protein
MRGELLEMVRRLDDEIAELADEMQGMLAELHRIGPSRGHRCCANSPAAAKGLIALEHEEVR